MIVQAGARLLFIMHDRPNYPGGPIVNYLRLLPRFVNLGYEVHLIAFFYEDHPNARFLRTEGVIVHPKLATSLSTQDLTAWILERIGQIQPDIFIPDVSTPGCFAGKWVRKSGIPVINTHRSPDDTNWGRAIYFSDPQSPYVSTGIVCVSNYLRNALLNKINNPALLTKVIPSGVDIPNQFSSQDTDHLSIVYAGRLVEKSKRIKDTINAFMSMFLWPYINPFGRDIGNYPRQKGGAIEMDPTWPWSAEEFVQNIALYFADVRFLFFRQLQHGLDRTVPKQQIRIDAKGPGQALLYPNLKGFPHGGGEGRFAHDDHIGWRHPLGQDQLAAKLLGTLAYGTDDDGEFVVQTVHIVNFNKSPANPPVCAN